MDTQRIKIFQNRKEAGVKLAERLGRYKTVENIVILALPRGGVPVAFDVAESLGAPLDVFITRKLRFPDNPELAVGEHYQDFRQVSDDEVKEYLEEAKYIDQFHKEVRL